MAILAGDPLNLKGIKYFDLLFCHNHSLTKPNISAEFELYHLLPGSAWFSLGHILNYCEP